MTGRKAFRISGVILFAMTAIAALWQLRPGWQINRLSLLVYPASLLLVMTVPFVCKWLRPGSEEAQRPWRRWEERMLVPNAAMTALVQAFSLTRSLGILPISAGMLARTGVVFMGIMIMVVGNFVPKAPAHKVPAQSARSDPPQLDPWQQNQLMRLMGKLLFGLGLFLAASGILLPFWVWEPGFLCLSLAALAAAIWYSIRLGREPSPLP